MAKTKKKTEISKDEVLKIYAEKGATAASEAAGVSKRTVQRWASVAGVGSGYKAPIRRTEPSAAAYMRGCRTEECVEAYRKANTDAKNRRLDRFQSGASKPDCGKASTYSNYDCRGEACKAAWSKYLRDKRNTGSGSSGDQLLVDSEGTPLACPMRLNPLDD